MSEKLFSTGELELLVAGVPHLLQKFSSYFNSFPHFEQYIILPT